MRAVVIDPKQRRVVLVPYVGDLFSFLVSRIGRTEIHNSVIESPKISEDGEVTPGVAVCVGAEALVEEGQMFFRLKGCHLTFPGTGVFLGVDEDGRPVDVPAIIWSKATSDVIWCPRGTKIKEWTSKQEEVNHPEHGQITRVTPIPIFHVEKGQ